LIHEAHGIHLPREVIRIHAGLTPDLNTHRDQAAAARYLTSPAAGVLTGVRGLPLAEELPGVAEVALYLAPGDRIQAAENIRDVLGYVIALGETAGEAARRADAAALEIGFDVASPEVSTLHG
jgi:biotin carboxylase